MEVERVRKWSLGLILAVLPVAVALATAACGGGEGKQTSQETATPSGAPGLTAVVISSDISLGSNRFMVGLLEENQPVTDAEAQFAFFKLDGDQGELRFEAEATALKMTKGITVDKPDGTREIVEGGETAAYIAEVEFDETGDWGVRITGTRSGESIEPINAAFTVSEAPSSIAIGSAAPKSVQLTLNDVSDLSDIDTSVPADPEWHQMTIADAVASGKPVAIAFSTPGFCQTQMCAPMTQELGMLYEKYKGRVNFVHVEPYFLEEARAGQGLCAVPAFNLEAARQGVGEGPGPCPDLSEEELQAVGESWNLTTEPWIFVVDAEGNVAAKFEAFVMVDEIEAAIKATLGEAEASPMAPMN